MYLFLSQKTDTQDYMVSCTLWSKSTLTVKKKKIHQQGDGYLSYWLFPFLALLYLREISFQVLVPLKLHRPLKAEELSMLHFLYTNLLSIVSTKVPQLVFSSGSQETQKLRCLKKTIGFPQVQLSLRVFYGDSKIKIRI